MKNTKEKQYKIDIYELEETYRPTLDIFNEDDYSYDRLKKIIYYFLDDTERRIILCYTETGNLRDTAKIFKVSTSTIWAYVNRIKKKILTIYRS